MQNWATCRLYQRTKSLEGCAAKRLTRKPGQDIHKTVVYGPTRDKDREGRLDHKLNGSSVSFYSISQRTIFTLEGPGGYRCTARLRHYRPFQKRSGTREEDNR